MLTRRTAILAGAGATALAGCGRLGDEARNRPIDVSELEEALRFLDTGPALLSGGPGDHRAAGLIRESLRSAGYSLIEQTVTAPAFECRRCSITIDGTETALGIQPHVRITGPQGITAALQLWRDSSDTDLLAGKIAVLIIPAARHSQLLSPLIRNRIQAALEGAPAGLILITEGPTGETIYLNAPAQANDMPSPVPLAVLGPKPGVPVIEAAKLGRTGVMVIDGILSTAATPNIAGRLERSSKWIVVSTPRTGWTRAVAERGPGFATFLSLLKRLPSAYPGHSILMLSTTAHEYDNLGSHAALEELAPPRENIALWLHLGAGFAARDFHEIGHHLLAPLSSADPQRFLLGSDVLLPALRTAFAGLPGVERAYPISAEAAGELAEIAQRGFEPVFGMFGAHRFHHADADRYDKTDPELVAATGQAVLAALRMILK